jgi:hypothetical protein
VDPLWQAAVWSAMPVAPLLMATAASVYGFRHRQPRRRDDPVERAYADARAHAASAGSVPRRTAPRHLPISSR